MTVFIVTNDEGRAWLTNDGKWVRVLANSEEAEWLAWSLSHRKLMWAGVSYSACKVVEIEFDGAKHALAPIDLVVNQIDTKTDKQGNLLKPGNYTIERKST